MVERGGAPVDTCPRQQEQVERGSPADTPSDLVSYSAQQEKLLHHPLVFHRQLLGGLWCAWLLFGVGVRVTHLADPSLGTRVASTSGDILGSSPCCGCHTHGLPLSGTGVRKLSHCINFQVLNLVITAREGE